MLHSDAHDRLDDRSMHHKPDSPQITSVFQAFSQNGAIHRGAFRHGTVIMGLRCVPLEDTAQKTSLTRHLTPWHSPQTTRRKTLSFCDASRTKNFELPEAPKWARRSKKTMMLSRLAHFFFFDDRAADGRKTQCKNEEARNSENTHFCEVHFFTR